jgi:hypothetical protein
VVLPAFAGDCKNETQQDEDQCKATVDAANDFNNGIGNQAGQAPSATGANQCGAGGNENLSSGAAADNMKKAIPPCQAMLQKCKSDCDQARQEEYPKLQNQQTRPEAIQKINQSFKNQEKCQANVSKEIARAQQAANALQKGSNGGSNTQSAACEKKDDGKTPQFAMPQQKPGEEKKNDPTPTATANNQTPTDPSTASAAPITIADAGAPTSFVPSKAANGSSSSSSSSSAPATGSAASMASLAKSAGATGGSGSGSSSTWDLGKGSTDPVKAAGKAKEGDTTDRAPANEFGDGAGGAASAAGSPEGSEGLDAYLPGGAKDPTKAAKATGAAGASAANAHPDIVSSSTNLFSVVTRKMNSLCGSKQLIGCN